MPTPTSSASSLAPILPRSTPEAQGVSAAAVLTFLDGAAKAGHELHSLMVLRHGNVIAEGWWAPYAPDAPHMLYSLSKSFCSTAAGLAIAEGYFSLDDAVVSFFPEQVPAEISPNLAALKVRHLLSMSVGHSEDPTRSLRESGGDWVRYFLAYPVPHEPGTFFVYNSVATYMVSEIVQKTTGKDLLEFLGPRLLEPLNITGATWERSPSGACVGGWGLKVRTEDIANFGQLYLQDGVWQGKRLLPEGWVADASAKHISNGTDPESDWAQGYGFQFWRCRHGAYRGDGAFGQYCVVLPEQDAVVAITSRVDSMQSVLNLIWEHLLPAMGSTPLPEDGAAQDALVTRLASLALPLQAGATASPLAAQVQGATYRFEANDAGVESVRIELDSDGGTAHFRDHQGDHQIAFGFGAWRRNTTDFACPTGNPEPTVVSAGWVDDNTLRLKVFYAETPFCPTFTFHFDGDRVRYELYGNIGFSPKERPALEGVR